MPFDVHKVIAAYQAGQQHSRQKQRDAYELEDRQFEIEKRKLELKALQLSEKQQARQEAIQQAQMLQGQPGQIPGVNLSPTPGGEQADVGATPPVQGPPANTIQALLMRARSQPVPLQSAAIPGASTPARHAPVMIPGVSGPDTMFTPQSKEQQDAATIQQKLAEARAAQSVKDEADYTLNPGDVRFRGGTQIASNPKPETQTDKNQQFRDVEKGGKKVREYFDGADPSKVTFSVTLGTINDKTDDPLTAYQKTQVFTGVTSDYQKDEFIKQSLKGKTARAIADQVIADPMKATNQLKSLYGFMKNLDPDTAVREGELALARQAQSYFQKWGATLARLEEGRVIDPKLAKELAQATKELAETWDDTAKRRTQQYKARADVAGVGPQFQQFLAGSQMADTPSAAGPKVGTEDGGYIFQGGNPADPKSWKKK